MEKKLLNYVFVHDNPVNLNNYIVIEPMHPSFFRIIMILWRSWEIGTSIPDSCQLYRSHLCNPNSGNLGSDQSDIRGKQHEELKYFV